MSIKYILNNNAVDVAEVNDEQALDYLPPKVYRVAYQDMRGFFLELVVNKFKLPPKLYGSAQSRIDKILTTYESRSSQTGALLTGSKGTGKTILTEALCNQAIDKGLPVILIPQPFTGAAFFQFMNQLGECVVLFDEFGKVYDTYEDEPNSQQSLLSFLDGPYSSKRLLLFTENNEFQINEFIKNRPGRVYYHFKYDRVEDKVIEQYCQDNSVPDDEVQQLKSIAGEIPEFSFDMLKHLVEEYNRYKHTDTDSIKDLIKDMNINYLTETYEYNVVSVKQNNEELEFIQLGNKNSNLTIKIKDKKTQSSSPSKNNTITRLLAEPHEESSQTEDGMRTLFLDPSQPDAIQGNQQIHKTAGYTIQLVKKLVPTQYLF